MRLIDVDELKYSLQDHYGVVEQNCGVSEDFVEGAISGLDAAMFEINCAPAVEAIPIEWLKQKYRENDPDSGNEDFDRYLWDSICYVLTAWKEEVEEEEWDSLSEIQYQRFLHL